MLGLTIGGLDASGATQLMLPLDPHQSGVLDTALDEVERDCAGLAALDGVEAATGARRLVERLALTLQGSLMVLHSPADLAEAFVESRLGRAKGESFGTLDTGLVTLAGATRTAVAERPAPPPEVEERATAGAQLSALRRELNSLVAMHHHRTGKPHGVVHNELRSKLGGPVTAMASADQLRERIAALRTWK